MGTFFILLFLVGIFLIACLVLFVNWLTGGNESAKHPPFVVCPHCETSQLREHMQCRHCLAPLLANNRELRQSDLMATARELKRMLKGKVIAPHVHDLLMQTMRREYMRITYCNEYELPEVMALQQAAPPPAKLPEVAKPSEPLPEREKPPTTKPAAQPSPKQEVAEEPLTAEVIDAEVIQPPAPLKPSAPTPKPQPEQVVALSAKSRPAKQPAVHPLDRPPETPRPQQPSQIRRSLADVFSAFMEEKNIRWGELLSGLLIVGSTIGLIVSLRHTLERIPYASALLAMLVTVAIFLAGVYTYKHWKLATTSRGLLIIGLLLVPLNFLAALVQPNDQHSILLYALAVAVGLSVFGWIVYRSSRILSEDHWPWLAVGIAVPVLSMMLVDRLDKSLLDQWFTSLLMLPTVAALVAVAWRSLLTSEPEQSGEDASTASVYLERLYLVVGIPLFAVACCLGFYVHAHPGNFTMAVTSLAAPLSLLSCTGLALGIAMRVRSRGSHEAAIILPGPTLALLGTAGVLASLLVAAADPLLLATVALAQAALLTLLAKREASSGMGYAATASLTLAYATGMALLLGLAPWSVDGTRRWLLELFRSGPMAVAFTLWAAALLGMGQLLRKRAENIASEVCLRSGMGVVAISLCMAGLVSTLHPEQASWTTYLLAGYALAALIGGSFTRQREISAAGVVFAAIALGNALYFGEVMLGYSLAHRLALAACGYGTLMLLWRVAEVAIMGKKQSKPDEDAWQHPLLVAAALATTLALPCAIYLGAQNTISAVGYLAWISGLWLAMSVLLRSSIHFFLFRWLLTVTAGYLAVAYTERYYPDVETLVNLRHLLHQVVSLAALSVVWMTLEAAGRRLTRVEQLLGKPGQVEREFFHYVALASVIVLAAVLSFHGIGAELNFVEAIAVASSVTVSYAGGFWLAWGLITAALAGRVAMLLKDEETASDSQSWAPRQLAMLIFLGATALLPIALALHAEPQLALATALRWCYATYGLLAAGAVVAMKLRSNDGGSRNLASRLSDPLLTLGAVPVCGITLLAFGGILSGTMPLGPLEGTWWDAMGLFVSYVIPLVMVVATMVTHGVALRRPRDLALGSVTLQASISLACCLSTYLGGRPFEAVFLVELLQANAIALPLFGLLWWGIHRWMWPAESEPLLDFQVSSALAASGTLVGWILLGLLLNPESIYTIGLLGAWPSWLAVGLTVALALISTRPRELEREPLLLSSALAAITLTAALAATWLPDFASPWIGIHVLQVGLLIMALVSTVRCTLAVEENRSLAAAVGIATVVGALVFALRGTFSDPLAPEWQVGVIAVSLVPLAWLAIVRRNQLYAYGTTLLAAALPIVVLLHSPSWEGLWINGYLAWIAGGISALCWAGVELWYQRRRGESLDPAMPLAVHRTVAWLLVVCSAVSIPLLWITQQEGFLVNWLPSLTASCLALLMLLGVVSLWDSKAQYPLQVIHMAGGWSLGWGLAMSGFAGGDLLLAGVVGVTSYQSLLAWLTGRPLDALGRSMTLPAWNERHEVFRTWLLSTAMLIGVIILPLCLLGVLNESSRTHAILWGMMPALMALQALLLIDNLRRIWLRGVVILLAVSAAVLLSWADLHDTDLPLSTAWLLRMIRTVIITAAMSFLLGVVGARRLPAENPWRGVLARGATACMGVAVLLLLPILATEVSVFERGRGLPIDTLHGTAVALSLIAVMITLFVFALSKGLDPLELGEGQKQIYVYAAEAVMVLIGGQIYLMVPELFSGMFREYWPLVVMGIAFAGVAISELARRSQLQVLAQPTYHTSLLLPLLPALGLWIVAANVSYSLIMFAAGALYTVLAMTRRSPLSTVAAIVAGNMGLWSLMHDSGWEFLVHPQFWLIPPAAAVLIAAQLQKERLAEGQLAAIRYVAMLVIYLSSMSEIFIHNVSESLWPIMLLATLAVAGALLGIALRIRAFLYTGTSFLFFAMFSMVWHMYRQVGHSAVLWVFSIGFGLALLLLFALFEKNREQLKGWVREVNQWEK